MLTWSVTGPSTGDYGTFALTPGGTWTYTPDAAAVQALGAGDTAVDTFIATVTDEHGATDSVTVSVTVNGTNDAPVAVDDAFATTLVTPVSGNVLADNGAGADSDVDGDTLTVSLFDAADHGTLNLNPDGTFDYTPNSGFGGTDSFTYMVHDGHGGTDTATVSIDVELATAPGQVLVLDENGTVVDDFTSIQDAIDSMTPASSVGWTVLVGAGTYVEQVTVDGFTDLTIKADGAVTIEAPAVLVQTATSTSGREVFGVVTVLNSTNVQIDGIDVDGNGNGNAVSGSNPNFVGVVYRDASGGLNGVDITGIRDAYPGGNDRRRLPDPERQPARRRPAGRQRLRCSPSP